MKLPQKFLGKWLNFFFKRGLPRASKNLCTPLGQGREGQRSKCRPRKRTRAVQTTLPDIFPWQRLVKGDFSDGAERKQTPTMRAMITKEGPLSERCSCLWKLFELLIIFREFSFGLITANFWNQFPSCFFRSLLISQIADNSPMK